MNYTMREDGRVERLCSHGVGHTVAVPYVSNPERDEWALWVHGCDGCCTLEWVERYKRDRSR